MPAQDPPHPSPIPQTRSACDDAQVVERAARAERTSRLFVRIGEATSPGEVARLRREVVIANMEVARSLAARYRGRGVEVTDLEQVAYLGLIQAVERFDLDREKDFLSFAVPTITGAVKRHFRDCGWAVRPPRRIQELQARISAATSRLFQQLGRSPRPREVADALGCDEQEIVEALSCEGAFAPSSLDMPVRADTTTTVGDFIEDDNVDLQRAEARLVVGPAIQDLGERDRLILELRFFHGWTQQEIGDEIGVTQMQVSRLLGRILTDLRTAIEGDRHASSEHPVAL